MVLSVASVPDVDALRVIHRFDNLSDDGVLSASSHLHNQKHGNKDLPLYQHKIVSISAAILLESGEISLQTLGSSVENEADILQEFDALISDDTKLIAWDMQAVEKPLINYRLLKHGIASASFHNASCISLKDQLSNQCSSASADLAGLLSSLGLPSSQVLAREGKIDCFLKKQLEPLHSANTELVKNICFIYLKSLMVKADISATQYEMFCDSLSSNKY